MNGNTNKESGQDRERRLARARMTSYRERLRAEGLKDRGFWVTPQEEEALRAFVEEMRAQSC